jgi:hypothetical protein
MATRKDTGASAVSSKDVKDDGVKDGGTPALHGQRGSGETEHRAHQGHTEAKDRFGGINWGAGFFGWLVAIGMTILLAGIVGAVVAAVGSETNLTQTDAEREAGTIGIAAAVTLLVVLSLAYFTGGYVAGRMSRFDGGKQGVAVWAVGLVITLVAIAVGAIFGNEYNIFDQVDLWRLPISTEELSWAGLITAAAAVVLTLLAAMIGGKVGHRYHDKVDRVAHR